MSAPGRLRGGAGVAAVVLVVTVSAAVGVAVGSGQERSQAKVTPSSSASTPSGPTPPTDPHDVVDVAGAEATTLAIVGDRARALRSGDLAGWLAPIDPANPGLRARERTLFANLRQLPFTTYRWTLDPAVSAGHLVPAATIRSYGDVGQVYAPGLLLTYQLTGYDAVPVTRPESPVLAQRSGRWVIVGELSTGLPDGLVEPWTVGRIRVARSPHALVVVSASDAAELPGLRAQAEQAVAKVSSMWHGPETQGWVHRVVLYATRDARVFASFLGRPGAVTLTDGVTRSVGDPPAGSVRDDYRVVLNPAYVRPGSSDMPVLLRHEFTHVATLTAAHRGAPVWAIEGAAEYTAYRGHPQDQRVSRRIGTDGHAHRLPRQLPASKGFYGAGQHYRYGYSWLAFEYLSETYGETKLRSLYDRLLAIDAAPDSAAARAAETAAFSAVLHLSERRFVERLDSWILRVLRG